MSREERRLAAVVFTDIVGFSSLAQRDEAMAIRLLDLHNSLIREILTHHGGREVKTIGDSFLLEFTSALEAVNFSVESQREMGNPSRWNPKDGSVPIKIGIHVGDVVERGGDVIGDAVNIASRIAGVAKGGEIWVSSHVRDQVINKVPYSFEKMPRQQLKNIELELDLYRVVLPAQAESSPGQSGNGNRIAVLPFSNISPDPSDAYFADGLTEELISALSEVRGLRVIARTSASRYKETPKSADQIGRELGVSFLLEGSVRKSGNRLRVTANLVDARTQEEVWSEKYDDDLSDVFSMQSGIAASVVNSLKISLLTKEMVRIGTKETGNMAAYVAYLKGRTVLREGTEESAHKAWEQFELAIKGDPDYAKAYSGKADSVMLLGDYLYSPIPVALDEAKKCVAKALALDSDLAEARVSLANLLMYDYKFAEAGREFKRAIEEKPSYATGHHWYSSCLVTLGRFEEAVKEVETAEELDPLSPAITLSVIYRTMATATDEETERRIRKLVEIDPESPLVDEAKMATKFVRRDWEDALFYLKRMIQRDSTDPYLDADLAYIYAVTGKREQALELVEKLKKVPDDARIRGQLLALAYTGLGDMDATFEWINHAVSIRESFIGWLRSYPLFGQVRADPRYHAILKKLGLE